MRDMLRFAGSLAAVWMLCGATSAHDLPISNMTIVAAEDTMHVELLLNATELNFFSELDLDKDGLADPGEIKAKSEQISRKIVDCFSFLIDGNPVTAAVHGVVPGIGTHHLTIRAHYTCAAQEAPVHMQAHLAAITRRTHMIEVTFERPDSRQAARLDARDPAVLFDYERKHGVDRAPSKRSDAGINRRAFYVLLVGLATLLGGLLIFLGKKE